MNVSSAASSIALQALAAQNAQQPSALAAAVALPQSTALALTDAASAASSDVSGLLGSLINTYA